MQSSLVIALALVCCACAAAVLLLVMHTNDTTDTPPTPPKTPPSPPTGGGGSTTGTVQAGALMGTLFAGTLDINIARGTGTSSSSSGKHAFMRDFGGRPFPVSSGGVILSFDIQFAPGFEWGCRGKIGGLHIGSGKASGGRFSDNGASARAMWDRGGGSYVYVYVPTGTASGQPAPLRPRGNVGGIVWQSQYKGVFQTGKWHRVDVGVKLNTPGKYDGRLLYAIDGRTSTMNNVLWRKGNYAIGSFSLGIFHGGGCEATRNSKMAVRNIRVFAWKE